MFGKKNRESTTTTTTIIVVDPPLNDEDVEYEEEGVASPRPDYIPAITSRKLPLSFRDNVNLRINSKVFPALHLHSLFIYTYTYLPNVFLTNLT